MKHKNETENKSKEDQNIYLENCYTISPKRYKLLYELVFSLTSMKLIIALLIVMASLVAKEPLVRHSSEIKIG